MKFSIRLVEWATAKGYATAEVHFPLSGKAREIGPKFYHSKHGHAEAYDRACLHIQKVRPSRADANRKR